MPPKGVLSLDPGERVVMLRRCIMVLLVLVGLVHPAIPAAADDVLDEHFEQEDWWEPPVDENGDPLPAQWLDYRTTDAARTSIDEAYHADGLHVVIPPGGRRGAGPLWLLPDNVEEAWFRYHINLESWDAVDDGKLPGFADIGMSTARGCNPSTEADPGWSARVLFHETGTEGAGDGEVQLGYYTYHLDQPGTCGEFMPWSDAGIVEQDRWYCIEGHVAMNTPGGNDGVLEAWVDGARVFSRNDLAFRRTGEDWVEVNTFWLNVYFGGSTVVNPVNLQLLFDELVVSDSGRVPCLTRFTDDDESAHEANIEFLFDEKIAAGCAQNLFCPYRDVSRAEMVAFLSRWVQPAPTTEDYFDDDDGHWAEQVLNRMAAARIIRGCGERLACPDVSVTRGQVAAFLSRTFRFPTVADDFFSDDDGSLFETDINTIAAAGVTAGCGPDRFCPDIPSRRDQTASLIARSLRWAGVS